jgi:membrane protein implicated in regulation of membrane protease activity
VKAVLDSLFVFSAIVGGGAFVLRTVLMLLGIGVVHSFGGDHDLGADHVGGATHSDTDVGARLISIQGIAAFLMIFGLVGLALTREAGLPPQLAVAIALAAGLAAMWAVAKVFALMLGLQSSGTLDLAEAVGQEGVVYLTIKPGAGGQVQVSVQGRLGVFEAQASGPVEIATGRAIRVVGVRSNQLVVEALPSA